MPELFDLSNANFRTTRAADELCESLKRKLGWHHRYVAARLAIARSLSCRTPPSPSTENESSDMARPLRGIQLFGDGSAQSAWLALIVQRSGKAGITRRCFQAMVSAHWKRGAGLLKRDWERSGEDMARFVATLAALADFRDGTGPDGEEITAGPTQGVAGEVRLSVGELARDAATGKSVEFVLNGPGGSPHMAIMGGVGSGKTRTAVHMLRSLRGFGAVPLLAFDFKGDLGAQLAEAYGSDVLAPPDVAIPLDVLHVPSRDENAIKTAAGRIRDSIASVKPGGVGGTQSEALREAILATLRAGDPEGTSTLVDVARALESQYEERRRRPDELTATLNELTQFSLFAPDAAPADFFGKSWVVRLRQDSSLEMRRLVVNLTLDALDRWLNALPDAGTDENGARGIRHVTFLDEAHVVFKTRLPALGNLIRMSRSKGGVLLLASQSPDDFGGKEQEFLDDMGMTLVFNTQANPGATRRIFGANHSLTGLRVGEALCRIRSEAHTRKVQAWQH